MLAIAVVIGAALGALVKALVDDFIMPIVGVMTAGGSWQKATLDVGPVRFAIGDFLSALVNFIIIGLVAWRITRFFIKPEPTKEPPATKNCPFCKMMIDSQASRCAQRTSQLASV